ncbi:MAG: hypothetical protein JWN06_3482 [Propionibacteriaceae bacterium]|jgi:hypothetical protein|nr:hypothetical protein [Propionibacteriaceae bacterium]
MVRFGLINAGAVARAVVKEDPSEFEPGRTEGLAATLGLCHIGTADQPGRPRPGIRRVTVTVVRFLRRVSTALSGLALIIPGSRVRAPPAPQLRR